MQRTEYLQSFKNLLITTENQYINLHGDRGIGKTTFLESLETEGTFQAGTTEWCDLSSGVLPTALMHPTADTVIIDGGSEISFSDIRTFIDSLSIDSRIIFTSEQAVNIQGVSTFELPGVSFREYSEARGITITASEIMQGRVDITEANDLLGRYIHSGHFPSHIDDTESIRVDFLYNCTIMKQELFKKEEEEFVEYMKTLAMNTGSLFKADALAKLLGISRRKVHKYTELMMKYGHIRAIGPWSEDATTETTRHVKVYFSDLSFLASLLGGLHFQGAMKQGAIENFLYLELSRKLDVSHEIYFYRKKSGSEISFLLVNTENTMLTPIEVTTRESTLLSQALKSFDDTYHERIEYSMSMNESAYGKKDLGGKNVIILPHIGI